MNRKNIVDSVEKNIKITNENKDVLEAIYRAKEEWQRANEYFNMVHDPELIDYAIYTLDAARARYEYLLSQAKKRHISVDYYSSLKVMNRE